MKYKIKNIMLCITIAVTFFSSLCSMDPVKKGIGFVQNASILTWSVILNHGIPFFDHDTICSLALVDKEREKMLRDTAVTRRTYLTGKIQKLLAKFFENNSSITWHKYGSACGKAEKIMYGKVGEVPKPKLILYAAYLGTKSQLSFHTVQDFKGYVPGFSVQYSIKEKEICFYYLRKEEDMTCAPPQYIIERRISENGKQYEHQCGLTFNKNSSNSHSLSLLASFPILLKAFLYSKGVYVEKGPKLYCLENVIIPENYKEGISCDEYKSFDALPERLKEAIDERYKAQQ